MGQWKFRPMKKSEKLVDPIQGQFFTTNIVGGLTAALVRETIQNSLDANLNAAEEKDENGETIYYPVEIRFSLCRKKKSVPSEKFTEYMEGVIPHLQAENNGLFKKDLPDFDKPASFLLIEDSNTKGLEGDPFEIEDPDLNDNKSHNFYWFWRNVGRSGKGNNERGRWGLGKTVFPAASLINTFFGLTVREEDGRKLLMGQSVLKIHKLADNENRYCPYGDFGEFEDKDDKFFVNPVESKSELKKFENDFGLEREADDGSKYPGLSVLIPYPAKEITRSELIKSVVVQYFYPIIAEKLIVVVEDDSLDSPIRIDSKNIDKVIDEIEFKNEEKLTKENLEKLFSFSKYALNLDIKDYLKLNKPNPEYAPIWKYDWYFDDKLYTLLGEKVEQFEKGERIAFKVPSKVQDINGKAQISWFKVYFEKDNDLDDADIHFVRDGITITGIKPFRRNNVRALVVIDEGPLAKLLGDAENPAHTEWQKDSPHFKGKYKHGGKIISFVINSLERLYDLLLRPSEGIDQDILKDVFYIIEEEKEEEEDDNSGRGKKDNKGDQSGELGDENINSKIKPIIISKIKGGIKITANQKVQKMPKNVEIKLAYVTPKGNPLKRYNKLDFDLSKSNLDFELENGRILKKDKNLIKFEMDSLEFNLSLTGFDNNRDLFVKADFND